MWKSRYAVQAKSSYSFYVKEDDFSILLLEGQETEKSFVTKKFFIFPKRRKVVLFPPGGEKNS